MRLAVHDYVGENAITRKSGQPVYDAIHGPLANGELVCLDFEGIKVYASPFLNVAIGQLYRDLSSDELNSRLKVENMTPAGRDTLRVVINTAKNRYGGSL